MRNILVVGVSGMIGSALFSYLKATKDEVWGTTHRDESLSPNVFYLNLADAPEVWKFPNIQFDVVYLCAGICRMNLCEADPVMTHKVNVVGMFALVRHFIDSYIVYLSTNQVFIGDEPFVSSTSPLSTSQ